MDRIALVIGNSNYQYVRPLTNPKNDANDMAGILEKLNFKVLKYLDLTLNEMECAVNLFVQELDDNATGLFYYAGHGMQIDGENYIVPTDCQLSDIGKTKVSCFCLDTYFKKISAYKGKTNICILDACRNNPFAEGRNFTTGFAEFNNQPKGTIIAYSTSPDCKASDGAGSNGLYTQVLKDVIQIPNLKIEDIFKSVRIKVAELSNDTQVSWEHSSLMGDFYFSVAPMSVNCHYTDEEIYLFINERARYYENITEDIYEIECSPYVDAYEKYKIPVVQIVRAYAREQYAKTGKHFTDATLDELNFSFLNSWGFRQIHGRWYFKERYVEMGDFLPLPSELAPLPPIDGKELKIGGRITQKIEGNKIQFILLSNIPKGTPLIFTLKGKGFTAQSSVKAGETKTMSEWFSNSKRDLSNGHYELEITSSINNVLPEPIKSVFGERNRNLSGKHIKFEPIGGNTICMKFNFLLKNNDLLLF